jgi:medium-chain acyl-[acyl-carrier-protein] hydrolase
MNFVWKEEISIRSYDVDCKNQLRINNLCSFFQDVAEHHASKMNVGFIHMRQAGMVWVLSKLEITFEKMPCWGDTITIETWPVGNERLYYRREFLVTAKNGEKLISATSLWLMINIQSRRPKLMPLHDEADKPNEGRYALESSHEVLPEPSGGDSRIIPVHYGDIDMNLHVNNTRYIYWVTDFFPVDFHIAHVPEYFRIDIKQEVRTGESVTIIKQDTPSGIVFAGKNCASQATCFQALIRYREAQTP